MAPEIEEFGISRMNLMPSHQFDELPPGTPVLAEKPKHMNHLNVRSIPIRRGFSFDDGAYTIGRDFLWRFGPRLPTEPHDQGRKLELVAYILEICNADLAQQ